MILVLFMFSPGHARDKTGAIWQTTGQVEHAERQHPREAAQPSRAADVRRVQAAADHGIQPEHTGTPLRELWRARSRLYRRQSP